MNINYDYYKIFYYVAKYKSFTGAADALLNNQPNITRMMKKLENELGCTLFLRQRHGVSLTAEGERLYGHISAAIGHILRGEEEIAACKSLKYGVVTVAASEIALHCVLLPVLKKFRKTYPGVKIRILNYSTPQAVDTVKKGLADFAIVTEPFETASGLQSFVLRSIREVPVCSNTFEEQEGSIKTYRQLEKYPLIGLGRNTASYGFYSDFFKKMGLSFEPDVEAATADQILPMIRSDLGIGFVPLDFLGKTDNGSLKVLDISPAVPERNICLLKRKGISAGIAAGEIEKMIRSNIKSTEDTE